MQSIASLFRPSLLMLRRNVFIFLYQVISATQSPLCSQNSHLLFTCDKIMVSALNGKKVAAAPLQVS